MWEQNDRDGKSEINKRVLGIYSGDGYEGVHASAGLGLKIVMNHNFIISCEYGKPFDKRDGKGGLNIGTNYIF